MEVYTYFREASITTKCFNKESYITSYISTKNKYVTLVETVLVIKLKLNKHLILAKRQYILTHFFSFKYSYRIALNKCWGRSFNFLTFLGGRLFKGGGLLQNDRESYNAIYQRQ